MNIDCHCYRSRHVGGQVLGQLPTKDNSPPDKYKAQPLTTIPTTIPHQENSPLGPLPRNKTTYQDQYLYSGNCPGGELSGYVEDSMTLHENALFNGQNMAFIISPVLLIRRGASRWSNPGWPSLYSWAFRCLCWCGKPPERWRIN